MQEGPPLHPLGGLRRTGWGLMGLPGTPARLPVCESAGCREMEDGARGPWGAVGGSSLSYTLLTMLPFLRPSGTAKETSEH